MCKVMRGGCGVSGSDVVVEYQPYVLRFNAGIAKPDNVLLHELVHALRDMRGLYLTGPAPAGFPNIEELFAVMIEDMYLSAAGRNGEVHLTYTNNADVGSPAELEERFTKRFPVEIAWFIKQLSGLSKQLASLSVPFNPLRRAGAGR